MLELLCYGQCQVGHVQDYQVHSERARNSEARQRNGDGRGGQDQRLEARRDDVLVGIMAQLQGGIEKVVRYNDGHCKNCEYNVCLKYNRRGRKNLVIPQSVCINVCLP